MDITLTEFVDFVIKSGTPKLTVVREAKARHRTKYDPVTDFYKKVRDGIIENHKSGRPKSDLLNILAGLTDKKKISAYPDIINGYQKFLGKKSLTWVAPPKAVWKHNGLRVSLNPEVGLELDGKPHIIKLYFKADPLTKMRVQVVMHLLQTRCNVDSGTTLGILDIRNSKLITKAEIDPALEALLRGEAASFEQIYNTIP